MTLRMLEIFVKVAKLGNMQQAARELYISAPSVSGAVAELERELGQLLFERLSRRLYITPQGERLLAYAERILNLYSEMNRQMKVSGAAQQLRLGATMTVAASVLVELLKKMPGPQPVVQVANTAHIERLLLSGDLDMALVEGRVHAQELVEQPIFADDLLLCCPREHPLAKCRPLHLRTLEGQPLLMREAGSGTREKLEMALDMAHIKPQILWECGDVSALLGAVRAGFGLTVISRRLIPPDLIGLCLVDFPGSRHFSLVYHKDKMISPVMQLFAKICRDTAQEEQTGNLPTK
ncbi:MAG: LysR family transcriptional regulator [Christensenellaceae bacterium]|nr:LysR family transcriptional regulator [Christensenellaceae bacterium]